MLCPVLYSVWTTAAELRPPYSVRCTDRPFYSPYECPPCTTEYVPCVRASGRPGTRRIPRNHYRSSWSHVIFEAQSQPIMPVEPRSFVSATYSVGVVWARATIMAMGTAMGTAMGLLRARYGVATGSPRRILMVSRPPRALAIIHSR